MTIAVSVLLFFSVYTGDAVWSLACLGLVGISGHILYLYEKKKKVLDQSEEKYRTFFENSADALLILENNAFVDCNDAAVAMLGYDSREELLNMHPSEISPEVQPDGRPSFEKVEEMIATAVKKGSYRFEWNHVKKSGDVFAVEVLLTTVQVGGTTQLHTVLRDLTEHKQAEEKHKNLELQLRQAQKMEAVGQLAGGIAHDFNNLLQVICGYSELLSMDIGPDHPAARTVEEIDKASQRGKKLVSQLLAFGRRQVMQPTHLNLNEVVEPLLQMIRGLIGEHIEMNFIPEDDLGRVWADSGLIEQVLMNLCVNARDAMADGGVLTIKTENILIDSKYVQVHPWSAEGRYVLLSVRDTGTGMDKQMLGRIFEPFFTTKKTGKGTGLGLSMAYGIITQHEGRISAYSEPGEGTVFKIYLPVVEHRGTRLPGVVAGPASDPVSGGTETLLLAEDDEAVLQLVGQTLQAAGYTVLPARDGEEAVRVFKENADRVDMLFFDVVMPRMGGKEASEEILKERPDLPYLFASGYSEKAALTNFIKDPRLHLLGKPYQTSALLRKVREVLEEARK